MNTNELNKAAEKYGKEEYIASGEDRQHLASAYKLGALSDAAKEYWYAQFKAEQKPCAGVWVKASELPEGDDMDMVFIRNIENKSGGMIHVFGLRAMPNVDNIEWLDEQQKQISYGKEKDNR